MRSEWIRRALNPTGILIRRRKLGPRHMHREEDQVTTGEPEALAPPDQATTRPWEKEKEPFFQESLEKA
jgi:hypothetical protein